MPQHESDLSSEAKQLESDPVLAAHGFGRDKTPRSLKTFLFPTFILTFVLSYLLALVFENAWFFSLNLLVGIPAFFLHFLLDKTKKLEMNDLGCLLPVLGMTAGYLLASLGFVSVGFPIVALGLLLGLILMLIQVFRNPGSFYHSFYLPGRTITRCPSCHHMLNGVLSLTPGRKSRCPFCGCSLRT